MTVSPGVRAPGRVPVWQTIARVLRDEIGQGLYPPGARLPSEAALAARFGVNRHTVRHALSALAAEGLTFSRRGAGVFVAVAPPADYALGRRVRFHANIAASGRTPSRKVLRIETRPAAPDEARALGCDRCDRVHVFEGVSMADDLPICHFRSIFPAARFPDLPAALERHASVSLALAEAGLRDFTRASTRVTAKLAQGPRAGLLRLAEGAPILRTEAINIDAAGQPVEYGISWFAGERVALTVAPEDL
ncbi:phosphonate metabolism transcriptional regulator PhnF [Phaeovulum vinaykumarii]|uniref:GntR family transcriptional regulator, phosphonate transport system regulatory protein n=1 Tax=Phaeovulum vinaykumarii TaxID=407234 RepID=A0A1N7LXL5_9RHOB|nr:phosphonate metabolism transcriptional regulator PhnF [Phaeovulum vinaykumarii]SIS78557.1 GntR family transcriptional regulator, phosphonate transport system regulatory protein [Phaeovulum vinaykumarii]SOC06963.1 GntR family phosphonate transport system transcriptional regulator [Phaeovulum vinaykumarii]